MLRDFARVIEVAKLEVTAWTVQEGCVSLLPQTRALPCKLCCIRSLICYLLLCKSLVEKAGPLTS